jgi:hypothetical protein
MFDPRRYAQLLATAKIRERPLLVVPSHFTELELQARWFAGDFGRSFTGTGDEEIEIVQFGIWNREAGPDFSDAAVRIDGELVGGSIEFDLTDQNWEVHGHATNPAFDGTVLHVFVESARALLQSHNGESQRPAGAGRSDDLAVRLSKSSAGASGTLSCRRAVCRRKNRQYPRRRGAIRLTQNASVATTKRAAWRRRSTLPGIGWNARPQGKQTAFHPSRSGFRAKLSRPAQ